MENTSSAKKMLASFILASCVMLQHNHSFAQSDIVDAYPEPPAAHHAYYENKGQLVDSDGNLREDILYYTENTSPSLFFSEEWVSFVLYQVDSVNGDSSYRLDMKFGCASEPQAGIPENEISCPTLRPKSKVDQHLNYYFPHCPNGILDVTGYDQLSVEEAFPKINTHFYSNASGAKIFFELEPDADPNDLVLQFEGQDSISIITNSGALKLYMSGRRFVFPQATAYQVSSNNQIIPVTWQPSWYHMGNGQVGLIIGGNYDHSLPLMIRVATPVLTPLIREDNLYWSTFYGGDGLERNTDLAVNQEDDMYLLTVSTSRFFPVLNGQKEEPSGGLDLIISKFDFGASREWATFFGGSGDEFPGDIVYDEDQEQIYVCGNTSSDNLPVQQGNSTFFQANLGGKTDAFIGRFTESQGRTRWVSYFGGTEEDFGEGGLVLDESSQRLFLIGTSRGGTQTSICPTDTLSGFPLCPGGGNRYFQADVQGGYDAFVSEFSTLDHSLTWSTYFGGDQDDRASAIALGYDLQGNLNALYVGGNTSTLQVPATITSPITTATGGAFPLANPSSSTYFQSTNGQLSGFTSKFDIPSFQVTWSTFIGGEGVDRLTGLATNSLGDLYAVGNTRTSQTTLSCVANTQGTFPICNANNFSYIDNIFTGAPNEDGFILRLNPLHQLTWSTYLGGEALELIQSIDIDAMDNVFIGGRTESLDPNASGIPTLNANFPAYYFQPQNSSIGSGFNQGSDVFISSFDTQNQLRYATYFGGPPEALNRSGDEDGLEIKVSQGNNLYVVGSSLTNLTPTEDPPLITDVPYFVSSLPGGDQSGFITRFDLDKVSTAVEGQADSSIPIKVYPNPVQDQLRIQFSQVLGTIEVRVWDLMGRLQLAESVNHPSAKDILTLDTSTLSKGSYILQIIGADFQSTHTLIK